MNKGLLKKLLAEYEQKIDEILEKYGERDGFVIEGQLWWDYYGQLISDMIEKIMKNELTEQDARQFYKEFGFGPKFYGNSFVESGLDKIAKAFLFLSDPEIPPEQKIKEMVEDPESEHYLRGVGINFVTLFLTSVFPKEYVQWNVQTDGALKALGMYPKKVRGEKRSDLYLKINEVCLEIKNELKLEHMPKVDNLLYCFNKGYLDFDKSFFKEMEEKVSESIKDVVILTTPSIDEKESEDYHLQMQYTLLQIGKKKGYDVWIAQNDQSKSFNGEYFADLCLREIPSFTQPSTLAIAKYIDVIWFKKGTSNPIRFFEIEHSTSIYSGLLRLNDVKIDFPLSKATIVIPKDRRKLFDSQIERRTFKYSELADICDCITYEELEKWFEAVKIDTEYR